MNALTLQNAGLAGLTRTAQDAAEWIQRSFAAYEAAADKDALRRAIAAEAAQYGVPMAGTTFYRRLDAWRASGSLAALPKSLRRPASADLGHRPTRLHPQFVGFWQELCFQSQRVTSAAYRSLFFDHLIAGKVIPGYGTDWRGILAEDYPDWHGPEGECPFYPAKFTPRGWGERNLSDLAPSKAALKAGRIGTAEASAFLPMIPNTRAGLPFGAVWVIDDRVHDQLVTVNRNLHAREVVELGALELLTAYYTYGMVPALENADGTKQMLRQDYMRYLLAQILCVYGIHKSGCLIAGENATARMGDDLLETVNRLTGGLVRFKPGSLMNSPLAKGLWLGSAGGNPKWKAPLESIHSLFKNEMAMISGSKGADPEHCPEQLAQQQRYHASIMKAGVALAADNPQFADMLASPFPRWADYRDFIAVLFDRVNRRENHRLEGWDACRFLRDMVLLDGPAPEPLANLYKKPEGVQAAWRQVLAEEPQRHSLVPMSPAQALASARQRALEAGELMVLDLIHVPEILGPALGQTLRVIDDRTMTWKDPRRIDPDRLLQALVKLPDGSRHPLPAGSEWLVHLSPFDARTAWVSRPEGGVVGTCPVVWQGTKLAPDAETIEGMKRLEAQERRRWAMIGQKRLADHAELIDGNKTVLEMARDSAAGRKSETAARADRLASDVVDELVETYRDPRDFV